MTPMSLSAVPSFQTNLPLRRDIGFRSWAYPRLTPGSGSSFQSPRRERLRGFLLRSLTCASWGGEGSPAGGRQSAPGTALPPVGSAGSRNLGALAGADCQSSAVASPPGPSLHPELLELLTCRPAVPLFAAETHGQVSRRLISPAGPRGGRFPRSIAGGCPPARTISFSLCRTILSPKPRCSARCGPCRGEEMG